MFVEFGVDANAVVIMTARHWRGEILCSEVEGCVCCWVIAMNIEPDKVADILFELCRSPSSFGFVSQQVEDVLQMPFGSPEEPLRAGRLIQKARQPSSGVRHLPIERRSMLRMRRNQYGTTARSIGQ